MARSFNGTSDLIAANAAVVSSISAAFSVAQWINGGTQTNKYSYAEGNSGNATPFFGIGSADTGTITRAHVFLRTLTTTLVNNYSTSTPWDSTWHHIGYTQDASGNFAIYVDGTAETSSSYAAAGTYTAPNRVTIGALVRNTTGSWIAGSLAGTATWTRQLAAHEMVGLASGVSPLLLGAAHFWPLFGVDSPEPDLGVGTHVTGTLTGTAFASGSGRAGASLLDLQGATVGA